MPDGISFSEAAACAEGAHYAFNFVNKVRLKQGDKVLVNGATGAIGSAALQILKSRNIYVTAVGNTPNLDLLKELGADKVIDYEKEDFTEVDTELYDFIFDAVGKSRFSKCKRLLTQKGVYISSELGPGAENLFLPFLTKLRGGKRVIFPLPLNKKQSLLSLKGLFEEGKFRAVIDRHYTPDQIAKAYKYVMTGQKTGSVVIDFQPQTMSI